MGSINPITNNKYSGDVNNILKYSYSDLFIPNI